MIPGMFVGKLENRSAPAILIRYLEQIKAYDFLDTNTKKVFIYRDTTFIEKTDWLEPFDIQTLYFTTLKMMTARM